MAYKNLAEIQVHGKLLWRTLKNALLQVRKDHFDAKSFRMLQS